MICAAERRNRARDAAAALRDCDSVHAVDVLDPATGPRERWSIEVTADRVGACIFSTAARHGLASPAIAP